MTETNDNHGGFELAKRRRASSPKFQRLCAMSRKWQDQIDAKRHEVRVTHMANTSARAAR